MKKKLLSLFLVLVLTASLFAGFAVQTAAAGATRSCNYGSNCPSANYTDVPGTSNWAHAGIDFCIDSGIMGSTKTDALTFEPNTACTRSMIVSILYRLDGSPAVSFVAKFPDVPSGKWYTSAVIWAYQNGIVSGYDNGKFGPDDKITREQMAVILKGYTGYCGMDTSAGTDLSVFPDANKVTWSKAAVSWAVAEGLISGKSNNGKTVLDPQGNATRAEVASIFMRYVEKFQSGRVCIFDEPEYTGDYGMWKDLKFWSESVDGSLFVYVQPQVNVSYIAEWYPSLWYGKIHVYGDNGSFDVPYEWDEATDTYCIEITEDMPNGNYNWIALEYESGTEQQISTLNLHFEIADRDTQEKSCVFYEEQYDGDPWIWKDLRVWSWEEDGDLFVSIQPQVDTEYLAEVYPNLWHGEVGITGDNEMSIAYSWDEATDTYTIRVDDSMPTGTYRWYAREYEGGTDAYIGTMTVPFAIVRDTSSSARWAYFNSVDIEGDETMWDDIEYWTESDGEGSFAIVIHTTVDTSYLATTYPNLWRGRFSTVSENGKEELYGYFDEQTENYIIPIDSSIRTGTYTWTAYETDAASGDFISSLSIRFTLLGWTLYIDN